MSVKLMFLEKCHFALYNVLKHAKQMWLKQDNNKELRTDVTF